MAKTLRIKVIRALDIANILASLPPQGIPNLLKKDDETKQEGHALQAQPLKAISFIEKVYRDFDEATKDFQELHRKFSEPLDAMRKTFQKELNELKMELADKALSEDVKGGIKAKERVLIEKATKEIDEASEKQKKKMPKYEEESKKEIDVKVSNDDAYDLFKYVFSRIAVDFVVTKDALHDIYVALENVKTE